MGQWRRFPWGHCTHMDWRVRVFGSSGIVNRLYYHLFWDYLSVWVHGQIISPDLENTNITDGNHESLHIRDQSPSRYGLIVLIVTYHG